MITQAAIYKHLRRWTGSDQLLYQHLLYFYDGVAATNTHQAIFISQPNPFCRIETVDGEVRDISIPIIDQQYGENNVETWLSKSIRRQFDKIKPDANNILWSGNIEVSPFCLKDWKSTLELLRRLSRKKSKCGSETPIILEKEDNNLVAYVYKSQYCAAKFYLHMNLSDSDVQWSGTFNVEFLYNFVDLISDLNLPSITISITTGDSPILMLESQDIWAVSTCYNMFPDFMLEELDKFHHEFC